MTAITVTAAIYTTANCTIHALVTLLIINIIRRITCEGHFCAKCVKITEEVYDMVTQRKDFHWYCGVCESKVMQCIQLEKDKDIERKLVDFMGMVEYKMKTVEGNVYKK